MTTAQLVEALVTVALVGLAGVVVFVWLRRWFISSSAPVLLCALRVEGALRWRLGLARLGPDHLEWFSIVGPSLRPELSWLRDHLELGAPMAVTDPIPGLREPVSTTATVGEGRQDELAFESGAYTAVRAWLESAPPGRNVNVA